MHEQNENTNGDRKYKKEPNRNPGAENTITELKKNQWRSLTADLVK